MKEIAKLNEVKTPYGNVGSGEIWAVVAVLGVVGVILWKSGIFKATKGAADVIGVAAGAASTIIKDVANLPQNLITVATLIPQLPMAITQAMSKPLTQQSIFDAAIQGKIATFPGSVSISQRTANMINSVYHRYSGVTSANWSQVARANGAIFDANGFIATDNNS
jgi:hypothetical protein